MKRSNSDSEIFESSSAKNRRLLREEELILDATELLTAAMEDAQLSKSGLAARLGKTKGFVSQVLSGNRNLTLRTIADIADALGFRVRLQKESRPILTRAPLAKESRRTRTVAQYG